VHKPVPVTALADRCRSPKPSRPFSSRMSCASVFLRTTASRSSLEVFDLTHPAGQWVPSGKNLGHQLQVVDSIQLESATHSVDRTVETIVVLRLRCVR